MRFSCNAVSRALSFCARYTTSSAAAALDDVGEGAEIASALVKPVERGQDLGIVSHLLAGLDVGLDGAAIVLELVFGDDAESPPEVLCDRGIEDSLRPFFERIGIA